MNVIGGVGFNRGDHIVSCFAVLLCCLPFSGCAPEEGADNADVVETVDSPIKLGTAALPSEQKTVSVSIGSYTCTGTLLNSSIVLTAAHCFPTSKDPTNVTVW